jgi:hypothetical protein
MRKQLLSVQVVILAFFCFNTLLSKAKHKTPYLQNLAPVHCLYICLDLANSDNTAVYNHFLSVLQDGSFPIITTTPLALLVPQKLQDYNKWQLYRWKQFVIYIPKSPAHQLNEFDTAIGSQTNFSELQSLCQKQSVFAPYTNAYSSLVYGSADLTTLLEKFLSHKTHWHIFMHGHGSCDASIIAGICIEGFKKLHDLFERYGTIKSFTCYSCHSMHPRIKKEIYSQRIYSFPVLNLQFDDCAGSSHLSPQQLFTIVKHCDFDMCGIRTKLAQLLYATKKYAAQKIRTTYIDKQTNITTIIPLSRLNFGYVDIVSYKPSNERKFQVIAPSCGCTHQSYCAQQINEKNSKLTAPIGLLSKSKNNYSISCPIENTVITGTSEQQIYYLKKLITNAQHPLEILALFSKTHGYPSKLSQKTYLIDEVECIRSDKHRTLQKVIVQEPYTSDDFPPQQKEGSLQALLNDGTSIKINGPFNGTIYYQEAINKEQHEKDYTRFVQIVANQTYE